ncbi:MAG TPA: response regulator, partial [Cellvibrionaceae bacterium]|nr:response regulator [Cellvibrionaceae bacterium]
VYRKPILISLIGTWAFTLFNFASQAATLNTELGSILGFGTYIFSSWCLCRIIATVLHGDFSFRPFWLGWGGSLILLAAAHLLQLDFWIKSLPIACAVAAPQLYWAYRALRGPADKSSALIKLFAAVLLINGLHFIDYPFLRPIPEMAVVGYSVVIATTMLFGILLPCIINNFLAGLLANKLRNEIESHKATELELESALIAAERSAKAKTIFLANMSHEIRTPINGILGLNDLLLESPLNEHQRAYANQVRKSSDELLNLVNNVLTLSKLESSEVPLQLKAFSLEALIKDIANHYAVQGTQECVLKFSQNPSIATWVIADEGKIKQIIYNLINNALKHSQCNTIECSLDCVSVHNNQGELQLDIRDNGKGVERAKISQLTRRFEQNEYSQKGGVGLGLSIVIEMLAAMDGSLEIDSDTGKGFSTRCTIPIECCAAQASEPTVATAPPANAIAATDTHLIMPADSSHSRTPVEPAATPETPATINDYFVLIVEDNPVNQMVIEGMLKKLELPFKTAANGAQTRALYRQFKGKFACILMDIQLPDASGLDLIREIRAEDDPVKILVISAFAFNEDEETAKRAGADGYLRKPYHFDHFKNALTVLYQTQAPTKPTAANL